MRLFVDDFSGERNRTKHLEIEMSPEDQKTLLDDVDFDFSAPLHATLDIERLGTTFRMHARFETEVEFECGRCVEMKQVPVVCEDDWVFMLRSEFDSKYAGEEVELLEEDLDVTFYDGDEIDLNEVIREAILLELPTFARCEDGDPECDAAFERYIGEEGVALQEEGKTDLRWAALKNISLSKKN